MKYTGFKCGREPLNVGDILSHYHGNLGYFEVVERPDGFWLTDCSEKIIHDSFSADELNDDIKLENNLDIHFTKVDKDNPTKEPPVKLYCDQCDETAVGEIDDETGKITWYKSCGTHHVAYTKDGNIDKITAVCTSCVADPSRKPPRNEIMEYFKKRYAESDIRVVPGHWPQFETKAQVDEWFKQKNMLSKYIDYLWSVDYKCTNTEE
jgi:hypothetical protein